MKIFTSSDIHRIDELSIEREGITSYELMERAASQVAFEIVSRWLPTQKMFIFAGPGNNGGDALAVARLLIDQGYRPEIFLLDPKNNLSPDCERNKQKLKDYNYPNFLEIGIGETSIPNIDETDVVIDGLFGSGLSHGLQGGYTTLVKAINESGAFVVSIDVPSGLFGEYNKDNILCNVVHANLTLTFQFPRLSFFFKENAECLGEWKVLDIGLDNNAIIETESYYFLIDESGVKDALRRRDPFSTKDNYGRLLLVAGSLGMMGAAVLSSRAALRSGAGIVKVHTPQCGYIVMQSSVPEAMVESDKDQCHVAFIEPPKKNWTVALGPGLGIDGKTIDAVETFLKQQDRPIVLDADALNCISHRRAMLNDIPRNSIITPHEREFDRIFGDNYTDEERFLNAIEISRLYKIVIVLKGHYTKVIRPDGKVFVNCTGNPGMATGGSGDVLTGIISSLLAQGYSSAVAATVGVYIHGLAGDFAKSKFGEIGMIAGDIVDCIGEAFRSVANDN